MSLESILIGIASLVLGGGGGFIYKMIKSSIDIKNLKESHEKQISTINKEKETILAEKLSIEKEIGALRQAAVDANKRYEDTRVLLNDAISAMSVLKAFEAIDKASKEKLKKIENTIVNGNVTPSTTDEFKKMLEEIKKKNEKYNQGRSEKRTTGKKTKK